MKRIRQLQKALGLMDHTHTADDILQAIENGWMQSFTVADDTWAVTQVLELPRRRVLEVFLVIGERNHLPDLYDQVMTFARLRGCSLVRAYGRRGWLPDAERQGWRADMRVYSKVLGPATALYREVA